MSTDTSAFDIQVLYSMQMSSTDKCDKKNNKIKLFHFDYVARQILPQINKQQEITRLLEQNWRYTIVKLTDWGVINLNCLPLRALLRYNFVKRKEPDTTKYQRHWLCFDIFVH